MAKCWYLLGNGDGQQLTNPREPNETSDGNEINKISWSSLSRLNVKYWHLEIENYEKFNTFSLIKERQNLQYEYKETLNSSNTKNCSEYNFEEHMHEIDEIRFILNGEIYYDIYDNNKQIIRIHLIPGDLIIIPKYHFHRTILPKNIESVTFLQLTQNPLNKDKEEKKNNDNDNDIDKPLDIKTYFMEDVQKNPKQFIRLMMESMKVKSFENNHNISLLNEQQEASVNGIGYVMGGRAKALASYPHLREFNGMLFVSGTSSRRPDNTHIGATKINDKWQLDIKKQTRAVLENIKIILGTVGAGLEHLLAITVFLVDFKDYKGMNQVYNEYFDGDSGPTRTTVAVARLPHPNLLIEIQCTAAKPASKL